MPKGEPLSSRFTGKIDINNWQTQKRVAYTAADEPNVDTGGVQRRKEYPGDGLVI
jgi:hypothetical protein